EPTAHSHQLLLRLIGPLSRLAHWSPPRRVRLDSMRPLPPPYDRLAARLPTTVTLRGPDLLGARLLTKDLAFPTHERIAFGLTGLLPHTVFDIEHQVELELERLRRTT